MHPDEERGEEKGRNRVQEDGGLFRLYIVKERVAHEKCARDRAIRRNDQQDIFFFFSLVIDEIKGKKNGN